MEGWGSGEPTGRFAQLTEGLRVQGSPQAGASVSTTTFSEPFRSCLPATGGHVLQSADRATQPTLSSTLIASVCLEQPHGHPRREQVKAAGDPAILTTGLAAGQ